MLVLPLLLASVSPVELEVPTVRVVSVIPVLELPSPPPVVDASSPDEEEMLSLVGEPYRGEVPTESMSSSSAGHPASARPIRTLAAALPSRRPPLPRGSSPQ